MGGISMEYAVDAMDQSAGRQMSKQNRGFMIFSNGNYDHTMPDSGIIASGPCRDGLFAG
jgi:hypothetical protein